MIEVVDKPQKLEVDCPSCGSSFSLLPDTISHQLQHSRGPGGIEKSTLAHFELLEQVGEGAFGAVWKARDTHLDRIVAIKLPRQGQLDADEADRFLREARAVAQLRHPNIVSC